ncbi:MAG: NTP transferase domain-containing protein [Trueperaceae bacterium]|nr:MAG: NTP transferase domain-containing protein [Trueperaceae bacterium]
MHMLVCSLMDYVCLAAGKGKRLGLLGRYLQKCMYPVGLQPFLEFSIRNLARSPQLDRDRDRLILVVGHRAEQVIGYFGSRYQGLAIDYLEQREQLGTGHALHLVYQTFQPSEPIIAWLADLYVGTALFETLQMRPERNLQTLAPGPEGEDDKVRVTIDGDYVTEAWCGSSELFDVGLWKFSPETLHLMMERQEGEYRVLPNLQQAIELGERIGFVRTEEWIHLGGTKPSPEENIRAVVDRVLQLEVNGDRR